MLFAVAELLVVVWYMVEFKQRLISEHNLRTVHVFVLFGEIYSAVFVLGSWNFLPFKTSLKACYARIVISTPNFLKVAGCDLFDICFCE